MCHICIGNTKVAGTIVYRCQYVDLRLPVQSQYCTLAYFTAHVECHTITEFMTGNDAVLNNSVSAVGCSLV
jgi:hypothetical protein